MYETQLAKILFPSPGIRNVDEQNLMVMQHCVLAHVARCVIINQDFISRGGHCTVEFRYEYLRFWSQNLRFCCKENEIFRRARRINSFQMNK